MNEITDRARRAELSARIRRLGQGHRRPVVLFHEHREHPVAVGIVGAIETDGVRMRDSGILVAWSEITSVSAAAGRDNFAERLAQFQAAALALSEAWGAERGDATPEVAHYPEYLPSFDEFAVDVQAITPLGLGAQLREGRPS